MLHIGGRWLHTYYYISANPNEVQVQTSTSLLTEEGELQFTTKIMSKPNLNISNFLITKQIGVKILKRCMIFSIAFIIIKEF